MEEHSGQRQTEEHVFLEMIDQETIKKPKLKMH